MTESPLLDEFRRLIDELKRHPRIGSVVKRGEVRFNDLSREDVAALLKDEAAYYFLIAAAGLNRTTLKKALAHEEAQIVAAPQRKAFVVKSRLPVRRSFAEVASSAIALRRADLERKTRGGIEQLFRERLADEQIPLLMSPPVRHVPGILIGKRKPDGVYPDPATHAAPILYLEIKNVRRVADDIQKRLYEVAEAALEMKFLYGDLRIEGAALKTTRDVLENSSTYRRKLRAQISKATPVVIVLMLCSKREAEKYREGAEAFVDRVFFQEEIEECLAFIKRVVAEHGG
ncbi:MAG: hypothetical protein IPG04_20945 [Polyangiaceae bacterium]|nr:hypothetical protein [Polyangiaceae bacterium]